MSDKTEASRLKKVLGKQYEPQWDKIRIEARIVAMQMKVDKISKMKKMSKKKKEEESD